MLRSHPRCPTRRLPAQCAITHTPPTLCGLPTNALNQQVTCWRPVWLARAYLPEVRLPPAHLSGRRFGQMSPHAIGSMSPHVMEWTLQTAGQPGGAACHPAHLCRGRVSAVAGADGGDQHKALDAAPCRRLNQVDVALHARRASAQLLGAHAALTRRAAQARQRRAPASQRWGPRACRRW